MTLRDVRAATIGGTAEEIVDLSLIESGKTVLVPLDFREPGNDAVEPLLPSEVEVRYEDCSPRRVTARDETSWLGGMFQRFMITKEPS